MARIRISGAEVDYELLGQEGAPAVALTPGGRFPKETPGLRELGEKLVAGGQRVLLWNRPNCGASDLRFDADNESEMHAETLMEMIRALDLGPTVIAGGSAGSRVSLIAASLAPEMVSKLIIWWISGGTLSLMLLASYYCGESFMLASQGGMEAVANAPGWAEQIARNPRNRDILLAQDPERFIETMDRWASFYAPSETTPVPGMSPERFARLTMPVLIFPNGESDVSHPRKTSDWVQKLIPHAQTQAAPWPDTEWNERSVARNKGEAPGLFVNWPKLAPQMLDFIRA